MDDVAKMDDKNFSPIEASENQMGNGVFEEDYTRARDVFTTHCHKFRDYHDYYLRKDVLVLADALIMFRNDLYSLLKMDLLRTYSLPQYSFAAFLSRSKVKIPYITDPTSQILHRRSYIADPTSPILHRRSYIADPTFARRRFFSRW